MLVLLRGSETRVLTTDMMRQLCSFHRRCYRGLTGDFIHQDEESGEWICPSSEEALEKAGCATAEECIQRGGGTILPLARSTSICGRCKSAKKIGSNLLLTTSFSSNDAAEPHGPGGKRFLTAYPPTLIKREERTRARPSRLGKILYSIRTYDPTLELCAHVDYVLMMLDAR